MKLDIICSSFRIETYFPKRATVKATKESSELLKKNLQQKLALIAEQKQKQANVKTRLDDIFTILDGLKNYPMEYDDRIVPQIIECIVVELKEQIKIVFVDGLGFLQELEHRNWKKYADLL